MSALGYFHLLRYPSAIKVITRNAGSDTAVIEIAFLFWARKLLTPRFMGKLNIPVNTMTFR